jgi:hypothetical protein
MPGPRVQPSSCSPSISSPHPCPPPYRPLRPPQRKDNVPSGSLAAAYPGGGVLFVTYSLLVSKVGGITAQWGPRWEF